MVEANLQRQINKQLFDKLELAYICVDMNMSVLDASDNLSNYGYEVVIGTNVEDSVDFMFGLDAKTELDLPMVESPSSTLVSVSLLPRDGYLTVLVSNATVQAEQRQLLQQKANENELLLERQKKLLLQLERASQQLEHKNHLLEEASRLQTSFLSGVSHEFRTPLTSIIGYTSLLQQGFSSAGAPIPASEDPRKGEYLKAVQRSSKHLLSLVENLLDHGKLDSDEIIVRPKPTDLIELFEDVELLLKPLSETKCIEFTHDCQIDEPAMVVIDDSRLRQCLINLVGNAIKFTDKGSVVLTTQLKKEILHVTVSDTGPGISQENLQKIRLPFWQAADTGKSGTGLGLTITERIIELMSGELTISSKLGEGTQVKFTIVAPSLLEEVQSGNSTSVPNASDLKVLLAEDDVDIADLIVMMMAERDIEVTPVDNGALAIDALKNDQFDLVLMDIHMPVMTGYEALEVLQQAGNSIPIVIMSASSVEADRLKAEALGCYDYIVKPVDVDDVVEIMNRVVEPIG